jgi:hypothetical protein
LIAEFRVEQTSLDTIRPDVVFGIADQSVMVGGKAS